MEKVMNDESLKAYRQKFPGPKQKISKNYNCVTSIPDSILRAVDSILNGVDSVPAVEIPQ